MSQELIRALSQGRSDLSLSLHLFPQFSQEKWAFLSWKYFDLIKWSQCKCRRFNYSWIWKHRSRSFARLLLSLPALSQLCSATSFVWKPRDRGSWRTGADYLTACSLSGEPLPDVVWCLTGLVPTKQQHRRRRFQAWEKGGAGRVCQIRVRCMMSHAHCGRFGPGPCSGFGGVPGVSSLSIARHDSGLCSSLIVRKTKYTYNHREGVSGASSAAHGLRTHILSLALGTWLPKCKTLYIINSSH